MNDIQSGGSYVNHKLSRNPFYIIKRIKDEDLLIILDKLLFNDYKTVLKKFKKIYNR